MVGHQPYDYQSLSPLKYQCNHVARAKLSFENTIIMKLLPSSDSTTSNTMLARQQGFDTIAQGSIHLRESERERERTNEQTLIV
jgi:hypothetical protein